MTPPSYTPDRTGTSSKDKTDTPGKPASLLSADGIFATLSQARDRQRAMLRRRRRLVSVAKFVLPALAAVLLVALAVFPDLRRGAGIERISYKELPHTATTPMSRMSTAIYRGVDAQGERFTITAEHAVQLTTDKLGLTGPKGDLTTNAGTWLMLNARHGVYHQKAQLLDLDGKVTLYRADGTTLRTRRAAVDIKGGTASGQDPVFAFGLFGTLHSQDGFIARDRGSDILFKGKSHLMLDQVNVPASPSQGTGTQP